VAEPEPAAARYGPLCGAETLLRDRDTGLDTLGGRVTRREAMGLQELQRRAARLPREVREVHVRHAVGLLLASGRGGSSRAYEQARQQTKAEIRHEVLTRPARRSPL
jgi:hypothetical protein